MKIFNRFRSHHSNDDNDNNNKCQTISCGKSKSVIDQLIHVRLRATYEDMGTCLICSNKHNISNVVTTLPCGHMYHSNCATIWLQQCCSCPICEHELSYEEEEDDDDGTGSSNHHDDPISEPFLHEGTIIMDGYSKNFKRTEPHQHDKLSLVARVLRLQQEEDNIH